MFIVLCKNLDYTLLMNTTHHPTHEALDLGTHLQPILPAATLPLPQHLATLLLQRTRYRNGTIQDADFSTLARELNTSRENVGVLMREFVRSKAARVRYQCIEITDAVQLAQRAQLPHVDSLPSQ